MSFYRAVVQAIGMATSLPLLGMPWGEIERPPFSRDKEKGEHLV